jgi:membrane protein YdbS with pleckstrin-like domain
MLEARMQLTALQVHKSWLIRAALVLLITVLADGVVVWFTQRPLIWAVLIPATLPLSMVVFVANPKLREERRKSQAGIPGSD